MVFFCQPHCTELTFTMFVFSNSKPIFAVVLHLVTVEAKGKWADGVDTHEAETSADLNSFNLMGEFEIDPLIHTTYSLSFTTVYLLSPNGKPKLLFYDFFLEPITEGNCEGQVG